MQGAGNDYVYIDTLGSPTSVSPDHISFPDLAKKISNRHFGVGGDGLIVIMPSANADFRMRMFNADGSEAQMCGNGTRCVAKYVHDKGFTDKTVFTLETLAGIKELHLQIEDGATREVTVDMGKAILNRGGVPAAGPEDTMMKDEPVKVDDTEFPVTAVGMGNPHGVIFVDKISDRHIFHYGPLLEIAGVWPEKANIEFIEVVSPSHIKMRVWERGSGETLACGTGACASVVAAVEKGLTEPTVRVELLGGDLSVRYDKESGHVFMTGPAEFVAEGKYYL
ncbi:MAG: diaminopimelate epimerase [Muribaculaceae bacterium]|nr:diaminopimelate epimerase [Muribaculaceae bacterium]